MRPLKACRISWFPILHAAQSCCGWEKPSGLTAQRLFQAETKIRFSIFKMPDVSKNSVTRATIGEDEQGQRLDNYLLRVVFYIFSLFLSYTDFKKFLVPNDLIITMSLMLLVFGFFESKIYISSIILAFVILLFFIIVMLLNRQLIIGGGDIKYMMLVGLYLGVSSFALFLIITGILQTFALLYMQKIEKRKVAPMVPLMFISVFIVELLVKFDIYTVKF